MATEDHTPPAGEVGAVDESTVWRLLLALEPGEDGAVDSLTGARLLVKGGMGVTDPPSSRSAQALLDLFLPLRSRPAFVVGQLGQSLDGRIATESGHSHYINGPEDIRRLHRLRALVDAVVVGAGTVEADDPRLTVREATGPNPVRVVLDPRGRLPSERHVFQDEGATLWLRGSQAPPVTEEFRSRLSQGVELCHLPDGPVPAAVLTLLRERGLRRVLVEGGGVTVSHFLAAGLLDRLHVTVAPLLIGSGRPGIQLPPVESLNEALRPPVRHFPLGSDLLFDLDLGGPGG